MKRNKIIAVVLVVLMMVGALVLASCDDGSENSGGGNAGTITVTGLVDHNGKYVALFTNADPAFVGFSGSFTNTGDVTGGLVSNGQVQLNVYSRKGSADYSSYKGNDTATIDVYAKTSSKFDFRNGEGSSRIGEVTVTFSSGVATGTFTSSW